MTPSDAVDEGQAEPNPRGCRERVEGNAQKLRLESWPVIPDPKGQLALRWGHSELEDARATHGGAGVSQKVDQGPLQQAGICADPKPRRRFVAGGDLGWQRGLLQSEREGFGHVERLETRRGVAGEVHEVLEDAMAVARLTPDLLNVPAGFLFGMIPSTQQVDRRLNHADGVAELVAQRSCGLAQHCEPVPLGRGVVEAGLGDRGRDAQFRVVPLRQGFSERWQLQPPLLSDGEQRLDVLGKGSTIERGAGQGRATRSDLGIAGCRVLEPVAISRRVETEASRIIFSSAEQRSTNVR